LTSSIPPDSSGHRQYLRSAKLEELQDSDLYSALLFAASDTMDAAVSVEDRGVAAARKAAAMKEIERREAPPRTRVKTPAGGVSKTPPGGISKTPSGGVGKTRSASAQR
jgi:hypothetical protein